MYFKASGVRPSRWLAADAGFGSGFVDSNFRTQVLAMSFTFRANSTSEHFLKIGHPDLVVVTGSRVEVLIRRRTVVRNYDAKRGRGAPDRLRRWG